jgi:hypothetical protein
METILIVVGVLFLFGLLYRNKGDSFLDTLGSGAKGCLWIVIIIIIIIIALASQ